MLAVTQALMGGLALLLGVLVATDAIALWHVFVLAAAANSRQVRAVVDAVEEAMTAVGAKLVRREGVGDARWVLLDYADVVVHVQLAEDRQYYSLERLWKDGPVIPLPDAVTSGQGTDGPVEATAS